MGRDACCGLLFKNEQLGIMRREKNGNKYSTFPGGGIEQGEDPDNCIVRELSEEFGVVVKPIRIVYEYHFNDSIQYFYLLDWISGDIHRTDGEEYQPDRNRGSYEPMLMPFSELKNVNLLPKEVFEQFMIDYKKFGPKLNPKKIVITQKD